MSTDANKLSALGLLPLHQDAARKIAAWIDEGSDSSGSAQALSDLGFPIESATALALQIHQCRGEAEQLISSGLPPRAAVQLADAINSRAAERGHFNRCSYDNAKYA